MITRSAAPHVYRCSALLLSFLSAQVAAEDTATPAAEPAAPTLETAASEAGVRTIVASHTDALGRRCELHGVAGSTSLRFLACGAAGLWVGRMHPDGSANLLAERDLGGQVTGFFVKDGKLWVEITSLRAQPLDLVSGAPISAAPSSAAPVEQVPLPKPAVAPLNPYLGAAAPLSTPAPQHFSHLPSVKPERANGSVVRTEPGSVIVNLGTADGVRPGEHIALYNDIHEQFAESEGGVQRKLVAVGQVVSASEGHARVQLGLNEQAAQGTSATRTQLPLTAALFAPPRSAGVWEVAFMARPFVVLDNLGFGAFLDASVGVRMKQPVHFEAILSPLGFATAKGGAVFPAAGVITGSFDSRLFEIGLGVGGQTVNAPDISLDPGSGLTLAQRVRIGSRDGIHLEALSYVTLFHSNFIFGNIRFQGQIPIGERSWLVAAGGGGQLGLGFGEVGLRVLMVGNGGVDSFFLTTVIGGVNVFQGCIVQNDQCTQIDYAGPMVGMGGEWRL
jgi:hypothetical protein